MANPERNSNRKGKSEVSNLGNFTPTESTGFEPLPAGQYLAQIIEAELRDNANGSGSHLHLTWLIMDGDHANRRVFQNVTIDHNNQSAVEIGQKIIGQICHAIGHDGVNLDSGDLIGKPCEINVIVKNDPNYGPGNDIKRIARAQAPEPAATPPPAAKPKQPPPAKNSNPSSAPWRS
jgi:hypothetical protein